MKQSVFFVNVKNTDDVAMTQYYRVTFYSDFVCMNEMNFNCLIC